MLTLGDKVKQLRRARNWKLRDVAERTGLSLSFLSAIESKIRPNPSFQSMVRLARAFVVPLEFFAEDADAPPTDGSDSVTDKIARLYDPDTQAFIASESSRPYVAFAKQLAAEGSLQDAPQVLQMIAQFLREPKPQSYQAGAEDSADRYLRGQ